VNFLDTKNALYAACPCGRSARLTLKALRMKAGAVLTAPTFFMMAAAQAFSLYR
jgi:hypothetical protein